MHVKNFHISKACCFSSYREQSSANLPYAIKLIISILLIVMLGQAGYAAEAYSGLEVEATAIKVSDASVSVELAFSNTEEHDFSFGWPGVESRLVMTTSDGEYSTSIPSAGNKITSGDTVHSFKVDCSVVEEIQSLQLTNLIPLDGSGLPQDTNLDAVTFQVDIPVDTDTIVVANTEATPGTEQPSSTKYPSGDTSAQDTQRAHAEAFENAQRAHTEAATRIQEQTEATQNAHTEVITIIEKGHTIMNIMQVVFTVFVIGILVLLYKMLKFVSLMRQTALAPTQENANKLLRRAKKLGPARLLMSVNMYYGQRAAMGEQFSKAIYPSPDIDQAIKDALYRELLALGVIHINKNKQ